MDWKEAGTNVLDNFESWIEIQKEYELMATSPADGDEFVGSNIILRDNKTGSNIHISATLEKSDVEFPKKGGEKMENIILAWIKEKLDFEIQAENEFGWYGRSEYYGEMTYICKASGNIYQTAKCCDVCDCLIDMSENIADFKNDNHIHCAFPIIIFNADTDMKTECKYISEYVNDWEKDSTLFNANEMRIFSERKEEN